MNGWLYKKKKVRLTLRMDLTPPAKLKRHRKFMKISAIESRVSSYFNMNLVLTDIELESTFSEKLMRDFIF